MTDVSTFTQSLIEMAEAVRVRPELEAEIARLKDDIAWMTADRDRVIIERENFIQLHNEAAIKLSEVTTQRDDAMFRNLELEEKLDQFASMAGKVLGMVKPQSQPTPEPVMTQAEPITPTESMAGPTQYDTTTGQTEPVPTQAEVEQTILAIAKEKDRPYFTKPGYMSDSEWESKGGMPKPTDVSLDDLFF